MHEIFEGLHKFTQKLCVLCVPQDALGTPPQLRPTALKTPALEAPPRTQGWTRQLPALMASPSPTFSSIGYGFAVLGRKGLPWSLWVPSFSFAVLLSFKETHPQSLVI